MFKVSRSVYLEDGRILDLREEKEEEITSEKETSVMVQPNLVTEYDLEKDMFSAYPQQGVPYSDSGSWIGMYNNGYTTNTINNSGI